jgi:hypothetical protein
MIHLFHIYIGIVFACLFLFDFKATFDNIPAKSWTSVLLVEETRVPGVSIKLCRIPMLILEQVSMLNSKINSDN